MHSRICQSYSKSKVGRFLRHGVEQVQRRFTKRLSGFHDYSCAERLQ